MRCDIRSFLPWSLEACHLAKMFFLRPPGNLPENFLVREVNGTDQSVNAIYRGRGGQKFENILWEGCSFNQSRRIKKHLRVKAKLRCFFLSVWRLNLSKACDAAEFEDAQIVAARVRLQIAFANVPCFGLDWTPDLALDCGLWTVLALAFLVL